MLFHGVIISVSIPERVSAGLRPIALARAIADSTVSIPERVSAGLRLVITASNADKI